jgi:hypothetical protein
LAFLSAGVFCQQFHPFYHRLNLEEGEYLRPVLPPISLAGAVLPGHVDHPGGCALKSFSENIPILLKLIKTTAPTPTTPKPKSSLKTLGAASGKPC